jgi:perosamine synthetase
MQKDHFLPFSVPLIEEDEIEEVLQTLRSGWITTGPKVNEFETAFGKYIGCKHAISVNSCTAALHLALDAIGVGEEDEIITSPMTFAATAEVIRYFKAKPLFIDIKNDSMNIDVDKLQETIERKRKDGALGRVKGIIPVHYGGYPCPMDVIMRVARENAMTVVEDAAHAFPCSYKGKVIGTIGDITCFSFYATKCITTGEGGMITTDNNEWAERIRIMRLHGISKDAWKRYTSEGNWYYEILAPGYKYNLTDLAAALGVTQLRKANRMWERREAIASYYTNAFKDMSEIETPLANKEDVWERENGTKHSWHLYAIKLNEECLSIRRDRFIEELKGRGIGTSVHFIPLHIHPYYRETYGYKPGDFPVAYETYKRIISLPIYAKMSEGDAQRVVEAVRDVVTLYRKVGK